jgi:tetratricopeptide (TPR) repeat protein/predicted Ser/Thr protein kinase
MVAWGVCPGEEAVAAYVAGQLPRAEREQLDSHLDTCSACQELVAMLAKGLAPPEQPRDVTSLGGPPSEAGAEGLDWNVKGTLGRYALLSPIGAGGMGVVYAAYDPELDRKVAVKVLRRTRKSDDLRAEARAVAKLAHPNVIAVHDVGEIDGEVYVAMEYVEGESLREWLRRSPRPTTEQILDIFVQAGRGIAAAHRVGLVHRDIKPSNIVVGADGRARVLDFGLALAAQDGDGATSIAETAAQSGEGAKAIAGTPAYMAPEQKRGERVDARVDQYAYCVALLEALGGDRDRRELAGVDERIARAIRRGLSTDPSARFATMDELLVELAPPPARRKTRLVFAAAALAMTAAGVTLTFFVVRSGFDKAPPCATTGSNVAEVWNDRARADVRAGFAATRVGYAPAAAEDLVRELDAWTAAWQLEAQTSCKATLVNGSQPASTDSLRQACLVQLLSQLSPVVALARTPDAQVVARANMLVGALPSPARCADVAGLTALPPVPPGESAQVAVAALRTSLADAETGVRAGRPNRALATVLRAQANALGYAPLQGRAALLAGRIEIALGNYAAGEKELHEAARLATASRDQELLADAWTELAQALGNDPRTADEAEVFFGYADAVVAELPANEARRRSLDLARCNVSVSAKDAARPAAACARVIESAEHAQPPDRAVANAARVRLGHYTRLQGHPDEALAILRHAATDAVAIFGKQHPDTAVAYNALGIAEISGDDFEHGIPDLRRALAIREAVFPGDSIQLAESLLGVGDALGASGSVDESIQILERGLAMLARLHEDDSAQAANAHMLVGMSLQDAKRPGEALPHYVKAADIADRALDHREALAAMALRLAASAENDQNHIAEGIPYLERALALVERAKSPPEEIGRTQLALGQFLFEAGGPSQRARGLALLAAAHANITAAGPNAADLAAELDAFARSHHVSLH